MRQVAAVFFILFLIWAVFPATEYQSQSLAASEIASQRLAKLRDALNVLNGSQWGDFAPLDAAAQTDHADAKYLNLTGFRAEDDFAWGDLYSFRERTLEISRHAIPPVEGQQLWDTAEGEPMWANASGTLVGDWIRRPASVERTYQSYNLSRVVPSMDWVGDKVEWARNVTGDSSRIHIKFQEEAAAVEYEQLPEAQPPLSGGTIRGVKGTVSIEDTTGSGFSWDLKLWGVHWPRQGVIMMTTTSEKFDGIFGLPHLAPGPDYFHSSRQFLNETAAKLLAEKEENIYTDQLAPWSSDYDRPLYTNEPSPHCEYVIYAQVHPPSRAVLGAYPTGSDEDPLSRVIEHIESELESPLGAPLPRIPKLRMSALMFSPDCGYFLESKGPPNFPPSESQHLTGLKVEVHIQQIRAWLLVYAFAIFIQVHLLKEQMRESYTPSNIGRVSFVSAATMVFVDGMVFLAAATWLSSARATFLPTLPIMFASFLSMTIGGSFLAKIYEVQLPEQRNRVDRNPVAGSAGSGTTTSAPSTALTPDHTGTDSLLPAPVTARRHVSLRPEPVIVPLDQDIDAEIADAASAIPRPGNGQRGPVQQTPHQAFMNVVGQLILLSLCLIFVAISSITWYASLRALFLNSCVFGYMSLWVPQIHRNAMRNCRRALAWPFVVGQSILRLLPIAYFWVKADNFLFARTDSTAFLLLCGWVWLQLVVLAAQDIVGPRFGIPVGWAPDAWDYHPVLREDGLENGGLPIGLVAEDAIGLERGRTGDDADKGRSVLHAIDCAICREVLEVPVVKAGEEDMSVAGVFARRMYMVTPCRHIFHTTCLEGWMRFRLQCPICREELPPL
ncbi:TUL1 RING-domain E3 ubiquitin ligase [Paramyrothecium foliicola]|nr:TUL1 RING-domain E3 ubiquitin ligase [Paramyrothecium foliicola]